jgi:membrane associated rhomboid family serine protease
MIPASVGFQCPECVRAGARTTVQPRTRFGGRISADPGWASKVLIGVNLLVFLIQQVRGGDLVPRFALLGSALVGDEPAGIAVGQSYRLLTAAFLHGSLIHIALNMYALYLFGPPLEHAFGRIRFVALYLISALGGSAVSYTFASPRQLGLGASGAIFGLFGAYIVVTRKLGRDTSGLFVLLAINVVVGFALPNIDWRAHAGGLVTGALLALVLVNAPRSRRSLVQAVGVAIVAVLVIGVVVLRTVDLTGASAASVTRCSITAPLDPGEVFLECLAG